MISGITLYNNQARTLNHDHKFLRANRVDYSMIAQLRGVICRCEPNVEVQHPLLSRGMLRLNAKEPYRQQVRALRRLAYGIGDTALGSHENKPTLTCIKLRSSFCR